MEMGAQMATALCKLDLEQLKKDIAEKFEQARVPEEKVKVSSQFPSTRSYTQVL
jgi:hypothetical protein